jgi:hypothetical protein
MVETLIVVFSLTFALFIKLPKLIQNKCILRIVMLVIFFVIFILHAIFMDIIKIKMPWYNPQFNPPEYYMTGWILEDQGYTNL